jgi:dihydroneopterin aldolase
LTVHLDLAKPVATDALVDALDYRDLAETVRMVAGRRKYQLLETLGGALMEEILALPRVESVELDLTKVHPPLGPEVGPIVVRLARGREASAE